MWKLRKRGDGYGRHSVANGGKLIACQLATTNSLDFLGILSRFLDGKDG